MFTGYLESLYGVYSIRIENAGVRRPPGDDVQIQGITDPIAFKKVLVINEQVFSYSKGHPHSAFLRLF